MSEIIGQMLVLGIVGVIIVVMALIIQKWVIHLAE